MSYKSTVLLITTVLFAQLSFASNSVFRKNSPVPSELQTRIIQEILTKYPCMTMGLFEDSTEVHEDRVDQGVRDFYYTTTLQYTWYFDGMHPSTERFTVKSAEYSISNPSVDRLEVISIDELDSRVCSQNL